MSGRDIQTTKYTSKSIFVTITGIMIALETILTMLVSIRIPATQGYFNLGEMLIYIAAIIFGPIVGFLTGGIGAAIADILLGYSIFAPGTFIIKGLEGFMVGAIYRLLIVRIQGKKPSIRQLLSLTIILYESEDGIELDKKNLLFKKIISMLAGAVVMITGYFLYELLIGFPIEAALIEIPINALQCIFGILIAIPIVEIINRALKIQ